MAKRCPTCKNDVSRYQEFCYDCGTELKRVAKRPKNGKYTIWKYFFLGMLVPPLGYIMFFFFSRDYYDESFSAFKGAIVITVLSFIFYRVLFWIGFFQPDDEITTGMILNLLNLIK